jgi:AraC-like DNA-binding protein
LIFNFSANASVNFLIRELIVANTYSSASHLSAQFKKLSGLTPTHFKQLKDKKESLLEDV